MSRVAGSVESAAGPGRRAGQPARRRLPGPLARLLALLSLLPLSASCGLFGGEDEPVEGLERLQVIADDEPFDPSEAVDDADDIGESLLPGTTREDAPAFAEDATVPADGGRAVDAPAGRPAGHGGESRRRRAPEDLPAGEDIATPAEVERRIERRRRRLEQIAAAGGSDREAKIALAHNPPAEDPGPGETSGWTAIDWVLEGVLLLLVATVLSGLIVLVRAFPKTVGLGLLAVTVLAALWVWSQSA